MAENPGNDGVDRREDTLYRAMARAIWLVAALALAFWFLDAILFVVLFFTAVVIFAMALNPPVRWLERHKVPRVAGVALVTLALLAVLALLGWLVLPRITKEVVGIAGQLPQYAADLTSQISSRLEDYPEMREKLQVSGSTITRLLPTVQTFLMRVGTYSMSAIGLIFFGFLLASTTLYALARPEPLLEGYLAIFPVELRGPAERAFTRSANAVGAWLWSNITVGALEAVASTIALTLLGVPGAMVWGALAFFSELVPRFGPYIMAIPPLILALTVSPMTALWVFVFYVAQNEITSDFITPLIRAKQMNLHPVSQLFMVLALGSAFGILGALLATPLTGFVKAYYEEFYLARQRKVKDEDERVARILDQQVNASG